MLEDMSDAELRKIGIVMAAGHKIRKFLSWKFVTEPRTPRTSKVSDAVAGASRLFVEMNALPFMKVLPEYLLKSKPGPHGRPLPKVG